MHNLVAAFLMALSATDPTASQDQVPPAPPVARAEGGADADVRPLPDSEARAVAVRFAPRFRLHPEESYLPVHPLFVLGPADQPWPRGFEAGQALGSTAARGRAYLALTNEERAARATIFYDVYRDERRGPGRVVAEYWLYFVESRYRTRGGFFPFPLDLSHPNDFEHVFLILAPAVGTASDGPLSTRLVIERIVANAHDGRIPNNITPTGADLGVADRPFVLVERGSHSLAPDVDGDGRVVAKLDVQSQRITWGLRDTGRIWAWPSADDADPRSSRASITLTPAGAPREEGDVVYQLEPMSSVDSDFQKLSLSPDEERRAFRGQVSVVKRLFGKSDGAGSTLRRPSSSRDHHDAGRLLKDGVERQRGLSLGFTNTLDHYSMMIGGRLPVVTPPRPWPVLTGDAAVVFPPSGPVLDAELLASYEVDTQVDIFGGAAWLANRGGQRQADWLVGLQLQLGRVRFRGALRGGGAVNNDQADFRIQYDLWK